MDNSTILFGAGAVGYLLAALAFYRHRHKILDAASGMACVTGLASWQAALAWNSVQAFPASALLVTLRFGLPLQALRFYFPALWPEAEADDGESGAVRSS